MYAAAAAQQAQTQEAESPGNGKDSAPEKDDGDTVDADFTVVDEDDDKSS